MTKFYSLNDTTTEVKKLKGYHGPYITQFNEGDQIDASINGNGGVAIWVKNEMDFVEELKFNLTETEDSRNRKNVIMLDYKALKFKSETIGELNIVGIYRIQTRLTDKTTYVRTSLSKFIKNMEIIISHDEIKNCNTIIAGDMNLDTLKDQRYSNQYKNLLKDHGWTENIIEVTHEYPNKEGGTCIDHIITNKNFNETFVDVKNFIKTKKDPEISDHKVTMAFWSKKDVK